MSIGGHFELAITITSDGTMIIYYKKNPSSATWWETDSPTTVLRLQNGSSTDYGWADPVSLDSTKGYYVIPSGKWTKGKMFRKGSGQTLHESTTFWNQTKTFDLDSKKNYIENYGKAEDSVNISWNRYTPQLTYSLTPSSTTIDNGGSVNFTSTNTSNNTSLVTTPTSDYVVTDEDGTCTLDTDYTVSGDTITFLKDDNVYTVTKKIEYYR